MSKISVFLDRYIKGKYHCDTCPYCWGGGYLAGCDDYDDCGCFIKGNIQDTCRLLPPFRFLLGYFKKKKALYYFNHQYDDFGAFAEKNMKEQDEFNRLLNELIGNRELCRKDDKGNYHPINTEMHVSQYGWRMRSDYDDFAHPIKHISLKMQWRDVIKNTANRVFNAVKPYFCK